MTDCLNTSCIHLKPQENEFNLMVSISRKRSVWFHRRCLRSKLWRLTIVSQENETLHNLFAKFRKVLEWKLQLENLKFNVRFPSRRQTEKMFKSCHVEVKCSRGTINYWLLFFPSSFAVRERRSHFNPCSVFGAREYKMCNAVMKRCNSLMTSVMQRRNYTLEKFWWRGLCIVKNWKFTRNTRVG